VNPTTAPLLEVHLLDYTGDLYRRHLQVRFLSKLRDEEKYDGVPALRAAIARDAAQARTHFAKNKTNA
jgi:riboflavin kinase/FMN adenylyltransferase